jgi:hypothetical protein
VHHSRVKVKKGVEVAGWLISRLLFIVSAICVASLVSIVAWATTCIALLDRLRYWCRRRISAFVIVVVTAFVIVVVAATWLATFTATVIFTISAISTARDCSSRTGIDISSGIRVSTVAAAYVGLFNTLRYGSISLSAIATVSAVSILSTIAAIATVCNCACATSVVVGCSVGVGARTTTDVGLNSNLGYGCISESSVSTVSTITATVSTITATVSTITAISTVCNCTGATCIVIGYSVGVSACATTDAGLNSNLGYGCISESSVSTISTITAISATATVSTITAISTVCNCTDTARINIVNGIVAVSFSIIAVADVNYSTALVYWCINISAVSASATVSAVSALTIITVAVSAVSACKCCVESNEAVSRPVRRDFILTWYAGNSYPRIYLIVTDPGIKPISREGYG